MLIGPGVPKECLRILSLGEVFAEPRLIRLAPAKIR